MQTFLYNTLYNSAATNLCEMIVNSLFYFIENVMEDVRLNDWGTLDTSETGSREVMKGFE